MYKKLEKSLKSVRERTDFKPEVAVVLGSGLGDFANEIGIVDTIDYSEMQIERGTNKELSFSFDTDKYVEFDKQACGKVRIRLCWQNSSRNYAGTCTLL